jgi:hypothetical protein
VTATGLAGTGGTTTTGLAGTTGGGGDTKICLTGTAGTGGTTTTGLAGTTGVTGTGLALGQPAPANAAVVNTVEIATNKILEIVISD